ncbi:hypothetical protein, partial [Aquabacterium sp. A08]|uniref:hypothetical protein n=1 Tax=Aquabacterium sp. A08 TaxID=2718532 RepID=UPI001AAF8E29
AAVTESYVTDSDIGTGTIYDDGSIDGDDAGTINDDDRPTLTINDVDVEEGSNAVFTVNLSKASESNLEVAFTTSVLDPLTAESGDIDPANLVVTYVDSNSVTQTLTADINGKYTIPAGVTTLTVKVPTTADDVYEGAETFTLSAAVTESYVTDSDIGTGTIYDDGSIDGDDAGTTNDNDKPQMSISNITVEEGSTAVFNVTVGEADADYTVTFGTSLTGQSAESTDFDSTLVIKVGSTIIIPNLDGSYTVPPGTTLLTVEVITNDDNDYEGPETFMLTGKTEFMNSVTSGMGTIKDDGSAPDGDDATDLGPNTDPGTPDDDRPTLSLTGKDNVSEGSPAVFNASLSNAYAYDVEVTLALGNVSTEGDDYSTDMVVTFVDAFNVTQTVNVPSGGTFTLPAGITDFKVRVNTTSDLEFENAEIFTLTASITGGSTGSDTATVLDDGSGMVYDDTGTPTDGLPDDDRPVTQAPPPEALAPAPTLAPAPGPTEVPLAPLPPFNSATVMQVSSPTPQLDIGTFPVEAILTSDIGFPVLVAEPGNTSLPPNLTLANAVTDQFADPGTESRFAIPYDTFAHTKADAQITLLAKLQDGSDLPSWVVFDPQSGTFTVNPPADLPEAQRELKLMVIARDQEGREAVAPFRFFVGDDKTKPKVAGRLSLTEQLKLAAKRSQTPWADWSRAPVEAKPVALGPAAERAAAQAG